MLQVAVVGYGNIGKAVEEALKASPDMALAGIVCRRPAEIAGVPAARDIEALGPVDVAVLCLPSRLVPDAAAGYLEKGIRTVDSFDIHSAIPEVRTRLDFIAKKHSTAAVLAAGWDPGTDSVVRTLMEAMLPKGITYTDFGPGMSMGHSVAARAADGVKDALSVTLPLGAGLHRRMVYVELLPGARFEAVSRAIKTDPYFVHDETHVLQTESVESLRDTGHGVHLARKGASGGAHNQRLCFHMSINNPALTGQVLVAAARACARMAPGCATMIEIPPIAYLPGEAEEIIGRLV